MSLPFADRLPLSRQAADRDGVGRSRPALFDELLADSAARVLVLHHDRTLVAADRLVLRRPDEVTAGILRLYLGRTTAAAPGEPAGTPVIATVLTDAGAAELEPDEDRWSGLRPIAERLSDRDAGLFTEALALANWHASHGYSPRNGDPTVVEQGGWVRRSPTDGSQVFPRTDPAIIVCVLDADDRLLLGSNAMWGTGRFSLLAGFVEPGESLEAAVIREIGEESGLRVVDPRYLGSQPWPFPSSLMVGFSARLAGDQSPEDLLPDGEEIVELRWFTRQQLHDSLDSVLLPGRSSIARAMIEDWYGGELENGPIA
ncbi:NAD(+) diphosphatase [Rathayibacter rathayi]|uniref:NAD(+) diphosphatase n=1 Tax=Rathayibacter rathayi TaxID=33887 RepID=A0ABD6WBX5_RATRA|nr:NAD(+) diphosphatase [Rathayibacter rathayi]AZZ48373.1 NAD(+) diphosphatase [Rathayibacter rathayi]MWV74276.1 NAD(+) diphosphatase [Rathayibacter rathayi NCPPB 2980 = VKM Ac-1601]PPF15978.1 NAD(+) diphosphatase [Rathayibacter rathayi]PPF49316.1 NAD(+) diphosphatase [Rathayibacter rathayi]PPG45199.1 NAD(+) diphosphatase [Rathayibacter rathayi]